MQKVTFQNNHKSFTIELKKRVDAYFSATKQSFTGNAALYIKSVVLISSAIALYSAIVFIGLPGYLSLILCGVLGFVLAAIGFNVMHDGAHGSYSKKRWVNEVMAYSLNILGGNSFIWKVKHNYNHHSFTNIEGIDDDINLQPFLRISNEQKWRKFHSFQHLYWGLLYCLAYLSWVYFKDFEKYFSGKIADTGFKKMKTKDHVVFWVSKLLYMFIFLVIPTLQFGIVATLAGYGIMCAICGLTLGIVFQLAHLIEGTTVHNTGTNAGNMNDWTIHQLSTTANFSTKSKVVTWFAGGLNFQVEHHLFPRISHVHYPALNKIVKEVCSEFRVAYNEYPTFMSAVRSHVRYLKVLGRNTTIASS